MNTYIYIDDVRKDYRWLYSHFNPKDWVIVLCHNYFEAVAALQRAKRESDYTVVDLDHDLGLDEVNSELSGYDICKYIVENNIPLFGFLIHSMNPVGSERMRNLLNDYGYEELI
jgi:hypothetical protein